MLMTEREVRTGGYWSSCFFACTDRDFGEVHSSEKRTAI